MRSKRTGHGLLGQRDPERVKYRALVLLSCPRRSTPTVPTSTSSFFANAREMGSHVSVLLFPIELVVKLCHHLDATEIHSLSRTCRRLRNVVLSSAVLQHYILLEETGTIECGCRTCNTLPLAQKTSALKRHQGTWFQHRFVYSKSPSSALKHVLEYAPHLYTRWFRKAYTSSGRRQVFGT